MKLRYYNTPYVLRSLTRPEPLAACDSAAAGWEVVEKRLNEHPDLFHLFIAKRGVSDILAAQREMPDDEDLAAVRYELFAP